MKLVRVPPGWQDALTGFGDQLADSGHSPDTITGYLRHLRRLAAAFPDTDPGDVTGGRLQAWLAEQNWSRRTYSRVLVSFRAFYRHQIAAGECSRSPVAALPVRHRPPGPPPRTARAGLWGEAIEDFLTTLRGGGRSDGTVTGYRYQLLNLAEHFPDPWQVTDTDLSLWLARPDLAAETRRFRRGVVQRFYGWAARTGRTSDNPAAGLPPVRIPRALPRPISDPALIETLHRSDDRQRLVLLLAALAGLRRAEIAGLRWRDWTPGRPGLLTVRGKGDNMRTVPVHPDLGDALTGWRLRPGISPDGYLFPSVTYPGRPVTAPHVGKVVRDVLPPGWTLHQLRHRFASSAYAARRDLRAVQELLGHMKPETTARYAAVPDNALAEAVAAVAIRP